MDLSKIPFLRYLTTEVFSTVQKPQPPSQHDITHVTEEMYKKNLELSERNRTLSILRKIDEIILGSVTNLTEIGQQVCRILILDAGFIMVGVFLLDRRMKQLTRIGFQEAESIVQSEKIVPQTLASVTDIPLSFEQNLIVQAVKEKRVQVTTRLFDILLHDHNITFAEAQQIQQLSGIKMTMVYPLVVRGEVLGAMMVSFPETEQEFSEYEKDLLQRLVSVVGIALDNALLYNEVQETNEKLQALDKLKDEFVSVASHELRTPMTAIKSYLWMALAGKGGQMSEKLRFYLDRAYNSTDRLIKLVNDMLNISRIESGRITIEMQSVKIDQLAQEIIEEVLPRAQELGVLVSIERSTNLPEVIADPDKIKEVFLNLIGNSMKFTPKGGKITVAFASREDMIETTITDTGNGILVDDLPKLFQKFGLMEGSYTPNQSAQGTGLGLYICKSIVELHEGKIFAESEGKGKGATFRFSLKLFTPGELERFNSRFRQEGKEKVGIVHNAL